MLRHMRRMVCFDGLRGVLACYVMLSHGMPFAPLPVWVLSPFWHGGAAVDVFFILSGLVIMQSLASFHYQRMPFLIARIARIYPVFVVVFAFAIALQPLSIGFDAIPWIEPDSLARLLWADGWPSDWGIGIATHLTMTHGLFPTGVLPYVWLSFLGAAWSLSTEWQFYLLALLIGARLRLSRMAWLFLTMAAVATVWQAATPETWQFSRAFLPNKAQYFALGIASTIVLRNGQLASRGYLWVLAATLALCVAQGGINKALPPLVWTACMAAQMSLSATGEPPRGGSVVDRTLAVLARMLQSKPLVWLGAVSYCIYLTNEPVQKLLGKLLAMVVNGDAMLFAVLWIPGAIGLPLLASWWLHERVEIPGMRWGRNLAKRNMATVRVQPVLQPVEARRTKVQ